MRKGALEELGGQSDFESDISTIRNRGVDIPLSVNEMGRCILRVVAFAEGFSRADQGPDLAELYFEWTLLEKRPGTSDGGLLRFAPPQDFSACTAVTPAGARDDSESKPRKVIMKLHVNWGHASARRLKKILADSESGNSRLVNFANEVLGHCGTCRAFRKAPHVPIAGTSTESMANEKAQVYFLFLDDIIALLALDVFPMYSLLLPVKYKIPREVWDV